MQINQAGLDLIKRFEGLRLKAYQDVAGIWTIGYGHIKSVTAGMAITAEQAEQLLKEDLQDAEKAVVNAAKVVVNDNEFSALVSLVFNIGRGAFAKSSTLKLLNKDDRLAAADAIELWNKSTVGGKKVVIPGLAARRAAEKGLFLTPTLASLAAPAAAPAPAPAPKAATKDAPAPKATTTAGAAKVPADTGPDSRLKPIESSRTRRDNLSGSRTIQGAAATAAAGAATAGSGASDNKTGNPQVQHVIDYMHQHGDQILVMVGVLIVMASLWIIAARIDDWSNNRR